MWCPKAKRWTIRMEVNGETKQFCQGCQEVHEVKTQIFPDPLHRRSVHRFAYRFDIPPEVYRVLGCKKASLMPEHFAHSPPTRKGLSLAGSQETRRQ